MRPALAAAALLAAVPRASGVDLRPRPEAPLAAVRPLETVTVAAAAAGGST